MGAHTWQYLREELKMRAVNVPFAQNRGDRLRLVMWRQLIQITIAKLMIGTQQLLLLEQIREYNEKF